MASEARMVSKYNIADVAEWCGGVVVTEHDSLDHSITNPALNLRTAEDIERAHIGDTIIKNHDGSFSIFRGQ